MNGMDESLLPELLESWMRRLRRERKSINTVDNYRTGVQLFLRFCDDTGIPRELTKQNVAAWLDAQHGNQAATVRLRLCAIKLFARWLAAEEGFDADPILAIAPPRLEQAVVADLSDNEIRRLVKACDGTKLAHKRDKAMVLVLAECGLRAAELLALDITDIDLDACLLVVRKGKGGKTRRVRFSPDTADVVDRYCRARRLAIHRPAEGPLWISARGTRLSYNGLVDTLKMRAHDAGVIGFHIHRLRHSMATRWLRAGGSEVGLRAVAGWASNAMVARYTAAASEQLAAEEFDRLNLGLGEL